MSKTQLTYGAHYYWNDPDDSLCSRYVRYIGPSGEPGVSTVEDEHGNPFSVFDSELDGMRAGEGVNFTDKVLKRLVETPLYTFPEFANMRVSPSGYVLLSIRTYRPDTIDHLVTSDVNFNIANVSRLLLLKDEVEDGVLVPKVRHRINIEALGGNWVINNLEPVKAKALYDVLNNLRLFFTGFLAEDFSATPVEPVPPKELFPPALIKAIVTATREGWAYYSHTIQHNLCRFGVRLCDEIAKNGGAGWAWDCNLVDEKWVLRLVEVTPDGERDYDFRTQAVKAAWDRILVDVTTGENQTALTGLPVSLLSVLVETNSVGLLEDPTYARVEEYVEYVLGELKSRSPLRWGGSVHGNHEGVYRPRFIVRTETGVITNDIVVTPELWSAIESYRKRNAS